MHETVSFNLKYNFSEKATKICAIFNAFSEKLNFTKTTNKMSFKKALSSQR